MDIVVPNLLSVIIVSAESEAESVSGIPMVSIIIGTYVSSPNELYPLKSIFIFIGN